MTPLAIAARIFLFPLTVFTQLLAATNTIGFYYSMFTLAVVFRLLIAPIIGQSLRNHGSDTARRKKPNDTDEK